MKHRPRPAARRSNTPRLATALIGVFLLGIAVAIVLSADRSTIVGAVVAALVVGLLGADACLGAVRDRPSLLQRLGPLP